MKTISTSYLALLETGKRTASIDILARIAKSCHVSLDYLILGDQEETDSLLIRRFTEITETYPSDRIQKGLDLLEYYLKLEE